VARPRTRPAFLPLSQKGDVSCGPRLCPPPLCPHPSRDPCGCPSCHACHFHGRDCGDGERFPDPRDPCSQCQCLAEVVTCQPKPCPTQCSHPLPPVAPACCPACDGCLHEGRELADRQAFVPPSDPCQRCTCLRGSVLCAPAACPPTPCAAPRRAPGQCCPQCLGKELAGGALWRADGSGWLSSAPCVACACLDGVATCARIACVSACADPVDVPGECCPLCPDASGNCSHQGRVFPSGKRWQVDACTACACVSGEVRCQSERCPPTSGWDCCPHGQRVWRPGASGTPGREGSSARASHPVAAGVPGTYKGRTCGLCGNFNGYPQDDLRLRSGHLALSEAAFGNSWKVKAGQRRGRASPRGATESQGSLGRKAGAGRRLSAPPFERCHAAVPPEPFFAACVFDLCACAAAAADDCLCEALAAYAAQCRHAGLVLRWPVGCPQERGYVFDECGPPCPRTCVDHAAPLGALESRCFKPCVPGCQCPAGLVEHEARCVPPEACPRIVHGAL
uniref:Kielin cysteine rich BMP regulator n=1 Tax=Varanus komodoensis TaxID=61221 RepID=A0A8D2LSU2_VARKO